MKKISACLLLLLAFGMLAGGVPARAQQDEDKLTLRQAVTLALENSSDLRLARVQYTVALNEASVARSGFRPNFYAGSGAAYTSGYPSVPGGGLPSIFNLAYNQSILDLPGKGQLKADEDQAANAKLEIDRVKDDVIVRTAMAYLELANVQHSLELMRNEQVSAEKILEITRERVAANQELPIEVTRSELTQARTQEQIVKLEDRNEILAEQIRNLTGLSEDQAIQVDTEEPSFATDQQESQLLSLAMQSDRGIQEAENDRLAREHVLKGAKGGYWPTVSLIGEYQLLAPFNNYKLYFNPNTPFHWNQVIAGIQVTLPIFSARTRANVALAKSQLNASELTLGVKRQQLRLDVQQKDRNVRELDATREVARLDLKLAQETLQVAQAKLDQGRATLQDVEQAHLDESEKWVAFLNADLAREQAQLTLLQATGQLAKVFQ
ncbi:MAG: TolC family protein [Candidatus Acidiferrales bacterium]